jgi:glycyl-tRNA synthetase beta subunit
MNEKKSQDQNDRFALRQVIMKIIAHISSKVSEGVQWFFFTKNVLRFLLKRFAKVTMNNTSRMRRFEACLKANWNDLLQKEQRFGYFFCF